MSDAVFGWDLLYKSVEKDIKHNQDILICLTHLVLVSNGFKCIGLGESKNIDGSEPKSEALPEKWNEDYAVRYVNQGRLYNFKATLLDDGVMMNLIRVDERSVSLLQLNSRSVAQRTGSLDEMIPDNKSIIEQIKSQLINKVVTSKKQREAASQTESETRSSRSDNVPSRGSYPRLRLIDPLRVDPANYGRADLDPFAGVADPLRNPFPLGPQPGGGMIFNPPRPGPLPGNIGIPPGALPPGARFDPFRPPDVDRFSPRRPPNRPDNDEFPPPGYDDMFM